jgi:phage tail sheath protein FI
MPVSYSRPGVYITEGPFSNDANVGPVVTPTAFLGVTSRGPIVPTRIDTWSKYKEVYGDLTNSSDLGYAVYHFFANGGRTAYITRVAHTTTTGGAAAVKAATPYFTGTIGGASATVNLFQVEAKNPGTWSNYTAATNTSGIKGLQIALTAGKRNGVLESVTTPVTGTGTPTTFNLTVSLNGSEIEYWQEVSLDKDSAQYAPTIINNYSNYINIVTSTLNANLLPNVYYTVNTVSAASAGGGTDQTVVNDDWVAALNSLNTVTGPLLINLPGQYTSANVNAALSYAETRGNGFVIIDPDPTQLTASTIVSATSGYSRSSYGAVYYPMLKMPDPARSGTATLRDTYPGGAIAGLYARVEAERTVGKAPAGYAYDLRGVYGLALKLTDAEVGTLYDSHINTMKALPGGLFIVNGARTLKRTDITKYVPVRRSLNYVKSNVESITQVSLFEPNGIRVWTDIKTRISRFLTDFWASGGLKGRNANEAFYIICDASNNPQYSVENGELHVEVGVALQTPAEFIVINISQFAGGTTTAEAV